MTDEANASDGATPLTDGPSPGWREARQAADPLALNVHLMHPGGDSAPGDPNAAFCIDGVYHLHYILRHAWRGGQSFSFVHVSSPDMLNWTWHETKLQPSFTGHGMFSGTGFLTREGRPAVIYHGQASSRNHIAIARDNRLSAWEKPYPIAPGTADGEDAPMQHWDPDCFLIGDTYYAISGGQNPPLIRSTDLKTWIYVGDFLKCELPDVAIGEDISCGNFFPLGSKWVLLCISHPFGCRYYIGDWDAETEQFAPETHDRMNWRREDQSPNGSYRDIFAPESVLTPDGRRVMWAWFTTLHPAMDQKTVQSLPRELSLGNDGRLRIKPLRELKSLRDAPVSYANTTVSPPPRANGGEAMQRIAELPGETVEIRITVERAQADRKHFGFYLFADDRNEGLPVLIQPETGALRLGATEAPFAVADLPAGEDVELCIFVDKYLVEVFANGRQAMAAAHMDYGGRTGLDVYTFGAPTTIKKVEIWKLRPTNRGYFEAQQNRIWKPEIE